MQIIMNLKKQYCLLSPLIDSLGEVLQVEVTIQNSDRSRYRVLTSLQPLLVLLMQLPQILQTQTLLLHPPALVDPAAEDARVTLDVDDQVYLDPLHVDHVSEESVQH